MSNSGLSRQLRLLLARSPDAPQLPSVLGLADEFVHDLSQSNESQVLLHRLEDDLQSIYHDFVDHSSLRPTEIFLSVLHHISPVLPSSSIISTWFDLLIRPALREPKLSMVAVSDAKDLTLSAFRQKNIHSAEKVNGFRRRLMDLYLLDAFNESSGSDILEWSELDVRSREKSKIWKLNLEDVLLRLAKERPEDLMTEINNCFGNPSSRMQLLALLDIIISQESFPAQAEVLATHPLLHSLLTSLMLDDSSVVCSMNLTVFVKLLPMFAVKACDELKRILPRLLAVLARVICWRERSLTTSDTGLDDFDNDSPVDSKADQGLVLELQNFRELRIRPELGWNHLEFSFNTATAAPSPRRFFTMLYYLFPCNVLRFFRGSAVYLNSSGFESPYTVIWEEALDEDQIRSKSESFLRSHILQPLVIWRDAEAELSRPDFWADYDVPRITTEAAMLDIRNAMVATQGRYPELLTGQSCSDESAVDSKENKSRAMSLIPTGDNRSNPARFRISIEGMIATSVALKSNMDLEILKPTSSWLRVLFPDVSNSTPSKAHSSLPPVKSEIGDPTLPLHIAQAISSLQREVLTLRNDLNFELWLSRENVKHIGRLFQDRILSKNAEVEHQGLYNKLRKYRAQVLGLERELRDQKEQASSAKHKYAEWNKELQQKLTDLREEKKAWIAEAAVLRNAEQETQARFTAQGQQLAEVIKEVFDLKTYIKERQHKIDRLADYERQIEQHLEIQKLWDGDFKKFNERDKELQVLQATMHQMGLGLESYKKTQMEMYEAARQYQRVIKTLEAELVQARHRDDNTSSRPLERQIADFAAMKSSLTTANKKLREENIDLQDEIEELKAMLEDLESQVIGKRGVISEPKPNPLYSASSSPLQPASAPAGLHHGNTI